MINTIIKKNVSDWLNRNTIIIFFNRKSIPDEVISNWPLWCRWCSPGAPWECPPAQTCSRGKQRSVCGSCVQRGPLRQAEFRHPLLLRWEHANGRPEPTNHRSSWLSGQSAPPNRRWGTRSTEPSRPVSKESWSTRRTGVTTHAFTSTEIIANSK